MSRARNLANLGDGAGTFKIGDTGGGAAHNNMQPFLALNCFIYAGV
jgi:microcystin-dependent protein